jgi:hypothetical protein
LNDVDFGGCLQEVKQVMYVIIPKSAASEAQRRLVAGL